jgi:hypothetical protein
MKLSLSYVAVDDKYKCDGSVALSIAAEEDLEDIADAFEVVTHDASFGLFRGEVAVDGFASNKLVEEDSHNGVMLLVRLIMCKHFPNPLNSDVLLCIDGLDAEPAHKGFIGDAEFFLHDNLFDELHVVFN